MTRPFNDTIACPNCGYRVARENPFSQWVRNNPRMLSRNGFAVSDCDYIFHRFMVDHDRECQCLMIVEVKTFMAEPTKSQRDTLKILAQFLRNDRNTPTKNGRRHIVNRPFRVYSSMNNKDVLCRVYGVHLLQLESDSVENGKFFWDRQEVTFKTLEDLLCFDLNPETLKPLDLRIHHWKHPVLFSEVSA